MAHALPGALAAVTPLTVRIVSPANQCARKGAICGIVLGTASARGARLSGRSGMSRHEAAYVRVSEREISRVLLGGAELLAIDLNLLLLSSAR